MDEESLSFEEMMDAMIRSDSKFDGVFYTCVKSTKIYCLPSCHARKPMPANVEFVRSKTEAEKIGYRACKKCFPNLPVGKWSDNGQVIALIPPKEFSFNEALVYLARSTNECLYHVSDHKVSKLINVNGEEILVEIGARENNALEIGFVNGIPKKFTRLAVAQYVWEWFDLDTDLTPFYELAEEEPLLEKLVAKYSGFRVIGIPDLFEALCWAIIGQQINLTFAYTLKRRFVESFGDYTLWDNQKYWLFPTPERITELSADDLKQLQFTGKKSEYVIEVAKQMASGSLSKLILQAMDFNDAERALVNIRGIGPWTANYVLMRCLRDPSAFPIEDVGLHNAIKQQLHLERKPTFEEIRRLFSTWKGWEAYATFYLWRSLYDGTA
jgi:DNA-3-methyladenine glycosylase II